jgi:hypothetical protein
MEVDIDGEKEEDEQRLAHEADKYKFCRFLNLCFTLFVAEKQLDEFILADEDDVRNDKDGDD